MPNDQLLYMRKALREHLCNALEVLNNIGIEHADIEIDMALQVQRFLMIQLFLPAHQGGINSYEDQHE